MAEPHPDWPPICLDLIKIILDGEVSREDVETARRFMRDLVDAPELLEAAKRHEAAAIDRLPKAQRAVAMQRGPAPVQRTSARPQPVPAPPPAAMAVAQGALW